MQGSEKKARSKKWIYIGISVLVLFFVTLLLFVNLLLEPVLKNKLHTLIIQGSDSLYTYSLGKLKADFFGGNVEVENLQINVDSTHYFALRQRNALPSLTFQLSLKRGNIKGVGILALLFGKKIIVREIFSSNANIRLSRHPGRNKRPQDNIPIWKAIRPTINSITIGDIRLDGIKLHYSNADTTEAVKLQFDRFDAELKDIQIDSTTSRDTSRIAFTKSIFLQFNDLKFRTSDSTYKMKAKQITYSSNAKSIVIDSFKLQPTLDKDEYYRKTGLQRSLYYVSFDQVRFTRVYLDHFIRYNVIEADSILFQQPRLSIYLDKTQDPVYESKIGRFPHEELLKASATVNIKNISTHHASVSYTETNPKTGEAATLSLSDIDLSVNNIVNDPALILKNKVCTARASGKIFGSSPLTARFNFYLDTTDGRFDASGTVEHVTAAQLNPISRRLTNIEVRSLNIHQLDFSVNGEDFDATANVRMRYDDLFIVLHKTDEETGATKTKRFMTKLLNRFVILPSNPGADGVERVATNQQVARLTTQSFFGLVWKCIFTGMENIILKYGYLE